MIAKRHQLLIAKNRKTISHIAVVELLVSEKNSKQDSDKIHYYDKLRHTNNIKVRIKFKKSGYENNFSELEEVESSRTSLTSRMSARTHFEVLGLEASSPWPRSLKSLASKSQVLVNCLFLGSRTALFFELLKFCWKTPETSRKYCKYLFCFLQLEHRLSQAGLPPIEISPMTKM